MAARRAQVLADEGKLVLDGLEAERKLLAQVFPFAPISSLLWDTEAAAAAVAKHNGVQPYSTSQLPSAALVCKARTAMPASCTRSRIKRLAIETPTSDHYDFPGEGAHAGPKSAAVRWRRASHGTPAPSSALGGRGCAGPRAELCAPSGRAACQEQGGACLWPMAPCMVWQATRWDLSREKQASC